MEASGGRLPLILPGPSFARREISSFEIRHQHVHQSFKSGCCRNSEPFPEFWLSTKGCADSMLAEIQTTAVQHGEEHDAVLGGCDSSQASVRIMEKVTEFEDLRHIWSAWSQNPEANLDFLSIRLRHARWAVRPHVMVVYRGSHPDCMLVGWLDQGPVIFKVGPFALFRCHARILRFVTGGFLGNQSWENSRLIMREIIKSLQKQEAQAAEFSQLPLDSPLHVLARSEPNVFCREHFAPVQIHRYLALHSTFDEYLRNLSRKSRLHFKSAARMLAKDFPGTARFQSIRSVGEVADFSRMADLISKKTYHGALGEGFVDNVETREKLHAAAQNSELRACILYVGEKPIAFACGFISKRTLYGAFTGYDGEFKKYSPGLQVVMRLIEESFEPSENLLRVDAGSGDPSYKRRLFDSSWEEQPVWIFASSAKGLSLHLCRATSALLHSLAMWLLKKSELLRRIRKMLHRGIQLEFQQKGSPKELS
jgi:hypothetical protein